MNKTLARIKKWIHPKKDEDVVNPRLFQSQLEKERDIYFTSMLTGNVVTNQMFYTATSHFSTPFYPNTQTEAQREIEESERRRRREEEDDSNPILNGLVVAAEVMAEIAADIPSDVSFGDSSPTVDFGGGQSGGGGSSDNY
jgi:hypothetical protein